MRLTLNSEPVSPTGSISSIGIINQLGRPNLDTIAVLIRETVQNSWDARLANFIPLTYKIYGWTLNEDQRKILVEQVFAVRPKTESLSMTKLDSNVPLHGLIIADRGTTGLAGPTRADIVPEGSPRNFISFLRDIGQPSNQNLSGGTYGYGKAALYRMSAMHTILIHTRCRLQNGLLESRFIVSALGGRWSDDKDKQYTGRHWWGRDAENIVEPILNEDADNLARSLGMGEFINDETGTTVFILDPLFHDQVDEQQGRFESIERTPLQSLNLMAENLLWFFWPKMLNNVAGKPAINFQIQWEDISINIPHPAEFPPLSGFVEAMECLKGSNEDAPLLQSAIKDINSERPRKHLGRLSLQQFVIDETPRFDTGETSSPFEMVTHHTALMRQAELVVKYLAGKPLSNTKIGYAGVFIADEAVDSIFASSEPPTHDDWNSKSLTYSWHKRFINTALRRIGEEMTRFIQVPRTASPIGNLTPLGAFATWLGESLIPKEKGTSASRLPHGLNTDLPKIGLRTNKNTSFSSEFTSVNSVTEVEVESAIDSVPQQINEREYVPSSSPPLDSLFEDVQGASALPSSSEYSPSIATSNITFENAPSAPVSPTVPSFTNNTPNPKFIKGRSSAEIVYDELVEYAGVAALLVTFNVKHAESATGTTIFLKAQAVLDSVIVENEPPVGGSTARVVRWISPNKQIFSDDTSSIYIAGDQPSEKWQSLIVLPDDIMVNIEISAKAEIVA